MSGAQNSKAATEMSGGQAPQENEAPTLDLPKDAVPMTTMSASSEAAPAAPGTSAAADPSSKGSAPEEAHATNTPAESADKPSPAAASAAPAHDEDAIAGGDHHPPNDAIGPSSDTIHPVVPARPSDGPVCNITLLLTTGARHPYRIDARYLAKRNVNVPGATEPAEDGSTPGGKPDPFSISVYTLKELILREWRDEWEAKPASPSSIRLIHFGKLLEDKDPLSQYHFSADAANVVHMTVRPADIADEEEPKGGNKAASSRRRSGGGCCVIL